MSELLELNGVEVVDTFAEAFGMKATRVIITAESPRWAEIAATEMTGYATSVIACDAEAGIERTLAAEETPDGRPGMSVLLFAFNREALSAAAQGRVGQCVLTCPTTACYNGIEGTPREKQISIGGAIRYFGDGFQISKKLGLSQAAGSSPFRSATTVNDESGPEKRPEATGGGTAVPSEPRQGPRRFWRLPVMDGEFLCEDRFGTVTGVAGGNLLLCARDGGSALAAAENAVDAMRACPDVILPFPGGIVRSGSKVGSKYPQLKASTNDPYCPTLRQVTESHLPDGCRAVYEIVIDGLNEQAVSTAMRAGLHAAVRTPGVLRITAGNYGGKLGKHHFPLRDLLGET